MASIRWIGKRAYVRWREDGRQKEEALGEITKRKAEIIRAGKSVQGSRVGPTTAGPLFEHFTTEYLPWHELEFPDSHFRIRQICEQYLIPFFAETPIGDIELVEGENYKHERVGAGAAPETVAKEIRTLKAVCNKAIEWERVASHRLAKLKPPKNLVSKPPPFYTVEQLASLWEGATMIDRWRVLVNTGIRRGEAMNLERTHVHPEYIDIISAQRARSKSGKWRRIPLTESAAESIDRLISASPDQYVFPRMNPRSLSRGFNNDLVRSGLYTQRGDEKIKIGSIHWLRHTFCSHLVMRGTDLRTVQELAGHSTITVTEQYAHLAPSHVAQQIAGLNL